jgi:hypothetical protein
MNKERLISDLNNDRQEIRLQTLGELKALYIQKPEKKPYQVNNHIHTTFSFSPYSPTKAVWEAYQAGLVTAGIVDHDTINGAKEFIQAGEILGLSTTIGIECRVDFSKTLLKGKRLNHPDQKSIAYSVIHGIPHNMIDRVQDFFSYYRGERNKRNQEMVKRLNRLMEPYNLTLDYDQDIIPISEYLNGGSITERHILFALSSKMVKTYGKGEKLVNFLKDNFTFKITPQIEENLIDTANHYYEYDLLGLMKKDLVSAFYINAKDECPDVREVIRLSEEINGILSYAYLGDVGVSVTGDKKSQKFEDDYLELLFKVLKELGYRAVTYMPTRNTIKQLRRLKSYCDQYGFFQISGEDINSPRQSFICEALKNEEFHNLIDSTWALIGHERAATEDPRNGMFSQETLNNYPDLTARIRHFAQIQDVKL